MLIRHSETNTTLLAGCLRAGVDVEISVRLLREVAAIAGSSNLLMSPLAAAHTLWKRNRGAQNNKFY